MVCFLINKKKIKNKYLYKNLLYNEWNVWNS